MYISRPLSLPQNTAKSLIVCTYCWNGLIVCTYCWNSFTVCTYCWNSLTVCTYCWNSLTVCTYCWNSLTVDTYCSKWCETDPKSPHSPCSAVVPTVPLGAPVSLPSQPHLAALCSALCPCLPHCNTTYPDLNTKHIHTTAEQPTLRRYEWQGIQKFGMDE